MMDDDDDNNSGNISYAAATDALKRLKAKQNLMRAAVPKSIIPLEVDPGELELRKQKNALRFSSHNGSGDGVEGSARAASSHNKAKTAKGKGKKRRREELLAFSEFGGHADLSASSASSSSEDDDDDDDDDDEGGGWSEPLVVIKGTSQALEKSYFRLTTAPDPAAVRPPEVLRRSLAHVQNHWVENEDYEWVCEQLKAIRQDLTVQMVTGSLARLVYRTHARLALENGDLNEYNQCQSRLVELRTHDKEGDGKRKADDDDDDDDDEEEAADDEFTAYRLLYFMYRQAKEDINTLLRHLSPRQKRSKPIAHALSVLKAFHTENYHSFFVLYKGAPMMSAYLMDYMVKHVREAAYQRMVKAYVPNLSVSFVTSELRFADEQEAMEFINKKSGPDCIVRDEPKGGGIRAGRSGGGGGDSLCVLLWDTKLSKQRLQQNRGAQEEKKESRNLKQVKELVMDKKAEEEEEKEGKAIGKKKKKLNKKKALREKKKEMRQRKQLRKRLLLETTDKSN